jgi:hypothetical protein
MYSLFRECLLQYPGAPGVNLCHAFSQFQGQFATAQVDVEEGCLNATVPGESGDLMNIPLRSCQIRQAQVARTVSGELRNATACRDPLHDFGPCPYRNRPAAIAPRFGNE